MALGSPLSIRILFLAVEPVTVGTRTTFQLFPDLRHTFNKELFAPLDSHKDSFFFHLKGFSVEKKESVFGHALKNIFLKKTAKKPRIRRVWAKTGGGAVTPLIYFLAW